MTLNHYTNLRSCFCVKLPDLEAMKEVTAVFVKMRSAFNAISFQAELKNGSKAMAINPIRPIQRLMTNFVGSLRYLFMVLTGAIIVVSGVSICVSIYNSMSDRRREIGKSGFQHSNTL